MTAMEQMASVYDALDRVQFDQSERADIKARIAAAIRAAVQEFKERAAQLVDDDYGASPPSELSRRVRALD